VAGKLAVTKDRGTMPLSISIGRSLLRYAPLAALTSAAILGASCAHTLRSSSFDDGGDNGPGPGADGSIIIGPGDATIATDDGGGNRIIVPPDGSNDKCSPNNPCSDFPSDPQFEGTAPMNAPSMFGDAGTGSTANGPCLAEPADGALYPKNWLRPRALWVAPASQTLFEVRVHADGEANDYVTYTTKHSWTMPLDKWRTIAWTPPQGTVAAQDGNLMGRTLTVTVRGTGTGGGAPAISNSAQFTIAPAIADGALIYWSTASFATMTGSDTNTTLQGFRVGDEGTTVALLASQVLQPVRAQPSDGGNLNPASYNPVFCIGCHAATPDGTYVSFIAQWPWATALASVQAGEAGAAPPWLTLGAISNLSPNINGYYQPPSVNQVMMGIQTFSPAHYKAGDRRLVASLGAAWDQTQAQMQMGSPGSATGVVSQLAWFDLEYTGAPPTGTPYNPWGSGLATTPLPVATPCTSMNAGAPCATSSMPTGGWGILARTGDTNSAGAPSWSHNVDGQTDVIAYSSTNLGTMDGRMDCQHSGATCTSDIYVVPYNNGQGGAATKLPGASKPDQSEYYPAFSPDDQLVAFNRVTKGTSMYNEPTADVYVVPYNGMMGGTEVPLTANNPVACTGATPGTVQNTWPRWAPNPVDASGKPFAQKDGQGNTYYWITFSSIRSPTAPQDPGNGNKRRQQLYVAGIVVDKNNQITTYAPIYLWNQDFTVNNLIPAWGEFSIPPGIKLPPQDAGIAY
jgi:hypothetical protein